MSYNYVANYRKCSTKSEFYSRDLSRSIRISFIFKFVCNSPISPLVFEGCLLETGGEILSDWSCNKDLVLDDSQFTIGRSKYFFPETGSCSTQGGITMFTCLTLDYFSSDMLIKGVGRCTTPSNISKAAKKLVKSHPLCKRCDHYIFRELFFFFKQQ